MTEKDLAAIEARCDDLYPGVEYRGGSGIEIVIEQDIPALIAEVRRLRAEVSDWEEYILEQGELE